MEREARLKEERDPNESQNVSCTSSGLRPRLLENSQKKSPRTKTRKHHRKNAKTLQKSAQNAPKMTPKWNQKLSQNGVCKCLPILLQNRAPMQVKHLFGENCLFW